MPLGSVKTKSLISDSTIRVSSYFLSLKLLNEMRKYKTILVHKAKLYGGIYKGKSIWFVNIKILNTM